MSNEVMTRNSEWMNHIVNHLNRMVDDLERAVMNYRPMLDGERFIDGQGALRQAATEPKPCRTTGTTVSSRISSLAERYSTASPTFRRF